MTYGNAQIPTPPPRRKVSKALMIGLIGLVVLVISICCAGAVANFTDNAEDGKAAPAVQLPPAEDTPPAAISKPAPSPSTKSSTILFAGDYEVGAKLDVEALVIPPGTYAIGTSSHCYWQRVKGFGGELDDIIANGNIEGQQVARVTVKKSDKGLGLLGDCAARRLK